MSKNNHGENQVRLFFATIKMLAFQDFDICPYEDLLNEYEDQRERSEDGEDPEFISYEELTDYIAEINLFNYGIEKSDIEDEDKTSFLLTNYRTGKILYVCFYNKIYEDISTDHANKIIIRCMDIWKQSEGEALDGGFFGPNSNYECMIVIKSKIGAYSRERITNIRNFKVVDEKMIMMEPFDSVFQSEMKAMPKAKFQKMFGNIPRSNMPSVKSTDQYAQYLGIKDGPVEIHRLSINEVDMIERSIHYKNINRKK